MGVLLESRRSLEGSYRSLTNLGSKPPRISELPPNATLRSWQAVLWGIHLPIPISVVIIERPGIRFDKAVAHVRMGLGFPKDIVDDLIQLLIRLVGDVENVLIAVLVALARLIRGEDKLLNILPGPLAAPDEFVIVLHFKIQLNPHDIRRLGALFEIGAHRAL